MNNTEYTPSDLDDHIAVSGVIKNGSGKVLMFKHKKFGFWTIPIGKAEPHETAYTGMCTELKEECGIDVVKAIEAAVRPYAYERNGKLVRLVHHMFIIEEFTGEPTNSEPEKHIDMKYMSVDEIRALPEISDATSLYLETLGQ